MTVDPFVLRGAAVGATWRAERGGAAGAVYHAVGSGPLPIASGLPVVVTLLDLAPWELPNAFQRSLASRFGQRLRAQLLRDAAAVIVGSEATAVAARRLIRIRRSRIHVSRWRPVPGSRPRRSHRRRRARRRRPRRSASGSALTGRYLVVHRPLRCPPRPDHAPVRARPAWLGPAGRPASTRTSPWPPRVLLLGATPGGPRVGRPGRRAQGRRRGPRLRAGLAMRGTGRAGPWRAGGRPARRLRGGRPAGHRGDRLRDPGRRVRGRAAAGDRRAGRAPRRTGRRGPAGRRADDHLGRRRRPRPDRGRRPGARRVADRGRGPTSRSRRGGSTRRSASTTAPG